ncbi:protein SOB FIVE-LIKE 5-like [Amaranthus tricolor]|uniref:protein SOB FIVE-LIKE 5-like n=1 Tax=Amaranthus tricolor TaxID=29722 RepID=UPI002587F140|nr:protein SOB FIVE-LIKE 5-like [Amaranthus tricolor]
MMNVVLAPSSECSSGCESGWTLYLEHSNNTSFGNHYCHKQRKINGFHGNYHEKDQYGMNNNGVFYDYNDGDDQQEEDLSMVSDASSGPPHFDHHDHIDDEDEDQQEVLGYGRNNKQNIKLASGQHQYYDYKAQDFSLDDTASSHIFTSKKNGEKKGSSLKRVTDYGSQGLSATHFHQGRSTNNFQEHYGFVQPPLSTKQFRQNQYREY